MNGRIHACHALISGNLCKEKRRRQRQSNNPLCKSMLQEVETNRARKTSNSHNFHYSIDRIGWWNIAHPLAQTLAPVALKMDSFLFPLGREVIPLSLLNIMSTFYLAYCMSKHSFVRWHNKLKIWTDWHIIFTIRSIRYGLLKNTLHMLVYIEHSLHFWEIYCDKIRLIATMSFRYL